MTSSGPVDQINLLPVEILSHVFTICVQSYPLPSAGETKYGPGPLTRIHSSTSSSPRRRKALAATISEVCARWRDIIEIPSNSHFYIAHLFLNSGDLLSLPLPPLPPGISRRRQKANEPFTAQLARFKDILQNSNGADLDFQWLVPQRIDSGFIDPLSPDYQVQGPYSIDSRDLLRLTLHSIHLASSYQRQWRTIYLRTFQPELISLLLTYLNRAIYCPSLVWVQINDTLDDFDGPPPPLVGDAGLTVEGAEMVQAITLHTAPTEYDDTGGELRWNPPSTLGSLYNLSLCRLAFANPFVIPPRLHTMSIIGQSPFEIWDHLSALASSSSTLHSLELDFPKAPGTDNPTRQTSLSPISFRSVKRLSLSSSHVTILHTALSLLFPSSNSHWGPSSVESLDLRINGLVSDLPDMHIPQDPIPLSSLKHLTTSYFTFHELQLLPWLHTGSYGRSELETWAINMWNPELSRDHYSVFEWPEMACMQLRGGPSGQGRVPSRVQIRSLPVRMVGVWLSSLVTPFGTVVADPAVEGSHQGEQKEENASASIAKTDGAADGHSDDSETPTMRERRHVDEKNAIDNPRNILPAHLDGTEGIGAITSLSLEFSKHSPPLSVPSSTGGTDEVPYPPSNFRRITLTSLISLHLSSEALAAWQDEFFGWFDTPKLEVFEMIPTPATLAKLTQNKETKHEGRRKSSMEEEDEEWTRFGEVWRGLVRMEKSRGMLGRCREVAVILPRWTEYIKGGEEEQSKDKEVPAGDEASDTAAQKNGGFDRVTVGGAEDDDEKIRVLDNVAPGKEANDDNQGDTPPSPSPSPSKPSFKPISLLQYAAATREKDRKKLLPAHPLSIFTNTRVLILELRGHTKDVMRWIEDAVLDGNSEEEARDVLKGKGRMLSKLEELTVNVDKGLMERWASQSQEQGEEERSESEAEKSELEGKQRQGKEATKHDRLQDEQRETPDLPNGEWVKWVEEMRGWKVNVVVF